MAVTGRTVFDDIFALLTGQRVDLADAPLDMDGLGDLDRQVYEVARTIPPGRTMSYGDIATRLGEPTLARKRPGATHTYSNSL